MPTTLPAGWMLAPVEPTAEMLEAARRAPLLAVMLDSYSASENMRNKAAYAAMLAAAPTPPACASCGGKGWIGGPSFYSPGEGGGPCPDCDTPPASAQDDPITVSLDLDPRGVSVGVWQGSRCIYNGAHAVPVAPGDAQDAERLRRIAWLIGSIFVHGDFNAETGNERELEKLLRENGTFWDSLAQFDAAIADRQGKGGE